MLKSSKKLFYLPSGPSIHTKLVSGGGGGPVALFTSPALNADDANPGNTFRVSVPITGNTITQIRATFQPGSTGSLTITHASIGKWLSTGAGWQTTDVPLELKFGGASGFAGATTSKTSDWSNLSGLSMTTGDKAIVIYDIIAGGPASQRINMAATGCTTYFKDIESWNLANPASLITVSGDANFGIVSVETQ